MNMSIKRHQYVEGVATKTFEELNFKEQAQSIIIVPKFGDEILSGKKRLSR